MLNRCRASLTALLVAVLTAACAVAGEAPRTGASPAVEVGRIDHPKLLEASGLAVSRRHRDRLWLVNDSGNAPELFATATDGRVTARYRVEGARNIDWEDLAAFDYRGAAHLLIGDIGDNAARRDELQLYLVPEPPTDAGDPAPAVRATETLRFRYEDGPRDAEGLAVDVTRGEILILSKREEVPRLYRLPLDFSQRGKVLVAERIGTVDGLPGARLEELANGNLRRTLYASSPTSMDLDDGGTTLAILTYTAVYRLGRQDDEGWAEALRRGVVPVCEHPLPRAEALAIDSRTREIYFTSELRPTPLLRISLDPDG